MDEKDLSYPGAQQAATVRQFFGDKHELKEYAHATADEAGWRTYERIEETVDELERRGAAGWWRRRRADRLQSGLLRSPRDLPAP